MDPSLHQFRFYSFYHRIRNIALYQGQSGFVAHLCSALRAVVSAWNATDNGPVDHLHARVFHHYTDSFAPQRLR